MTTKEEKIDENQKNIKYNWVSVWVPGKPQPIHPLLAEIPVVSSTYYDSVFQ